MKYLKPVFITLFLSIFGISLTVDNALAESDVTVFSAASTAKAMKEICKLYEKQGHGHVRTSFASSSTLAKQIANGAPADVFLSANKKWMDFLEEKNAINVKSRFDLLGNRIALIVPVNSPVKTVEINKDFDIQSILGNDGRFSIGDPAHVPAGMYGKSALENIGLWPQVNKRLAKMKDVLAALVMVERAETPLGIVYTTDAANSRKVRVAGVFPLESHRPVVYPIAQVSDGNLKAGAEFINFIKSPEASSIFKKYGFEVKQ